MHLRSIILLASLLVSVLGAGTAKPHPLRSLGGDWPLYGKATPFFTETDLQTSEVLASLSAMRNRAAETKWALANFMPERALAAIEAAEGASSLTEAKKMELRQLGALAYQLAGQFKEALALLGPAASADERTQAWIDFLQKRAALAEEIVAPLVTSLRATPGDADLWAQLAEAWSDDMIYCPRNALAAAAEALALDPENTHAKRAEEWALAQFVLAAPGRRVLARGLEIGLYFDHQPEAFPDAVRQRVLTRLEQPLENNLIHWVRNVVRLSALSPAEQYRKAVDYRRTVQQSLLDDPTFPNAYLPTFDAVLTSYSTATPAELKSVRDAILDGFGREYFVPELRTLSWIDDPEASLVNANAAQLESAVSDLEMRCKVVFETRRSGERHGPNWNVLQPGITRLMDTSIFARLTPADRMRLAEAVEKAIGGPADSVSQLASLANFHASLALAARDVDPAFNKRCDDLALDEFFKLVEHEEVTWREMIPAALYTFRTGRAPGAQIVANKLSEFPTVYGVVNAENPTATCHAWIHAGLLHLQVQTDPKIAEDRARFCFEQAKAALPTDSGEQSLVSAAQAVLAGRSDPALRRKLFFDGTDEGLASALRYRLATAELVNAISHLAGPLPSARFLAWTSPSIDDTAYQAKIAALVTELKQLPPAPLWRELEKPDTGAFARSIGDVSGVIRSILEQRAPEAGAIESLRGKPNQATANPDYATERAAFLDLAVKGLDGLTVLAESAPTPHNLTVGQYEYDVRRPFIEAVKDLGPDGLAIQQRWARLDARLGLALVRAATDSRPAGFVMKANDSVLRVLDYVERQAVLPPAQVAAVRRQYEKQRDQIVAQHEADVRARQAAEEARRARLAAIPADPEGVITIRDNDGNVVGGLDFRTSAPKPQYTYTPPPEPERPKDRPCDTCNGSGVVYEVTSYSNRAAVQCWRCKGKGRLPF